ncbi:MAG: DUF3575 domain-containing protein [Flavobacteriales bacterium]
MKNLIATLFCFVLSFSIYAQANSSPDILVKKDSTRIECKVTEVSEYDIKYYEWEFQNGPIFTLGVDKIAYIRFASGKVMDMRNSVNSVSTDIDAAGLKYKNIIKVGPFSPFMGQLNFEYERNIKPKVSCITEIGYQGIHLGDQDFDNMVGFNMGGGLRYYFNESVRRAKSYYNSQFSGVYVQMKATGEYNSYDYSYYTYSGYQVKRVKGAGGSLMLGVGNQWVFGGRITIDAGLSGGYGFASNYKYMTNNWAGESFEMERAVRMNHLVTFNEGNGFAFDGWFKLGVLF